ncbi:MAG: hypothetical protein AB1772_00690 [Candidatus Zixiibacteriota bacterium]
MTMKTELAPYQTEKLTFAAFLIASGRAELIGIQPIGHSKNVSFLLSSTPTDEEITAFFSGTAQVSALRYAECIGTLKAVAYEGRSRHGAA